MRKSADQKISEYGQFSRSSDKAFNIAHRLTSMVYKFFDTNSSGGAIKSKIMSNQQLAELLHKPVTRKFKKPKVYSFFKDSI